MRGIYKLKRLAFYGCVWRIVLRYDREAGCAEEEFRIAEDFEIIFFLENLQLKVF